MVCRQLGFPQASQAFSGVRHGQGSGPIWMAGVSCSGNESHIYDCNHRGWGNNDCTHDKDASVQCLPVRLANGGANYGRVEVFYKGIWGTVCDTIWDIHDAHVVCRELGFPSASSALKFAPFGEGSNPVRFEDISCQGGEASLFYCTHRGWARLERCARKNYASIPCTPLVRLAGGGAYYGRVEVYYKEQWGTVCDDDWDIKDAKVVCRQLGFPSALEAIGDARYGQGSGHIWIAHVECSGNETKIHDCSHRG